MVQSLSVRRQQRPGPNPFHTICRPDMSVPLTTRLRALTSLSEGELKQVEDASTAASDVAAHADIVPEGHGTGHLHVLAAGWACRYKLLPDGRRQICALVLPGDLCDMDGYLLRHVHYGVATLTPCRVAAIPHATLRSMIDREPAIRDVFWWLTFLENSVSTQWTVCLGRMSTQERLAHLLCEIADRLETAGMIAGATVPFPLTQEELADVLGVSPVHVNRTLQELRAAGLITLDGRQLVIHDQQGLAGIGCFSTSYLHPEGLRPPAPGAGAH